jgi:hypothetical protein
MEFIWDWGQFTLGILIYIFGFLMGWGLRDDTARRATESPG